MLIELFLIPIFSFIQWVLSLLPALSLPPEMISYLQQAFGIISGLGALLPLQTVSNVFTIILAFYGIQFIISFSNWVFRKVPGIS